MAMGRIADTLAETGRHNVVGLGQIGKRIPMAKNGTKVSKRMEIVDLTQKMIKKVGIELNGIKCQK